MPTASHARTRAHTRANGHARTQQVVDWPYAPGAGHPPRRRRRARRPAQGCRGGAACKREPFNPTPMAVKKNTTRTTLPLFSVSGQVWRVTGGWRQEPRSTTTFLLHRNAFAQRRCANKASNRAGKAGQRRRRQGMRLATRCSVGVGVCHLEVAELEAAQWKVVGAQGRLSRG